MRIGLTENGKYNIIEGNDVLCQCATLTEASAVLLYLSMKPVTVLERGIARTAIHNWDEERKQKQEQRAAKKARQKAQKKAKTAPDPESNLIQEGAVLTDDGHREEESAAESGETN